MDKYQASLMTTDTSFIGYVNDKEPSLTKCFTDGEITITQNADITVAGYILYIAHPCIDQVFAVKSGNRFAFNLENNTSYSNKRLPKRFAFPLSFNDKIDYVLIVFKHNLADDLIIPVKFIDADKDLYYKNLAKEQNARLLEQAQLKHSTGTSLVNFYFQPCCNDCARTEIDLYLAQGHFSYPTGSFTASSRLSGGKIEQLIGKYVADRDTLFKSVSGLARGVYGYKIRQLDATGNVLCESDFFFFQITK